MNEDFPQAKIEVEQALAERGISVEYFQETFGLGLAEISQHVEWGSFKGQLYEALIPPPSTGHPDESPKECPLGSVLAKKYAQGGLEAVEEKLNDWMADDDKPPVIISQANKTFEHQKRLAKSEQPTQQPSKSESKSTKDLPKVARPVIRQIINRTQEEVARQEAQERHPSSNPPRASLDIVRHEAQIRDQQTLLHQAEQTNVTTIVLERPVMPIMEPKVEPVVKSKVESVDQTDPKVLAVAFEQDFDQDITLITDGNILSATDLLIELPETAIAEIETEHTIVAAATTEIVTEPAVQAVMTQLEAIIEMPEPVIEETQNLVASMPAVVAEQIDLYLETAEPEETQVVAEQIVFLAAIADRLNVLYQEGRLESSEAQQIEALIYEEYEQLLIKIGLAPDEILIKMFIESIKSDTYKIPVEAEANEIQDVMHERIQGLLGKLNDGFKLADQLPLINLSRYLLRRTTIFYN